MRLSAVIHKEKGWFIATNPETGTTTQGKTFDEAMANLQEATPFYAGKRRTAPAGVLFPCTEKFSLALCGAS